jgi:hypothetical protein
MDALTRGLSVRHLAHAAGVTERTARRWRAKGEVPEPYRAAISARTSANAGLASHAWAGWSFYQDQLISPEGVSYTPAEIRAAPLQRQALEAYKHERARAVSERSYVRDLTARADALLSGIAALIEAAQHLEQILSNSINRRSAPKPDKRYPSGREHRILLRIPHTLR